MIDMLADDVKVMSKGQVTIPKKVREALGVDVGDRATFIVENGTVMVVNSAVYAIKNFKSRWRVKQKRPDSLRKKM